MEIQQNNAAAMPPLSARGLLKRLGQVPSDQLVVAFYVHNIYGGQYEWMNVLAKKCNERGMLTIAIHTPRSFGKSAVPAAEIQAVTERALIRDLERIDAFILSDMDSWIQFPERSKVLACVHTFAHSPADTAYEFKCHFSALADGLLIPQTFSEGDRRLVKGLWNNLFDFRKSQRPATPFMLIPCGYPRIAAMKNKIDQSRGEKAGAILYAPTVIKLCPENGGRRVRAHGLKIVDFLLRRFPDRRVIFRPYYGDLDAPEVREIVEYFRDEPRFEFDSEMAQAPTFNKTEILISDYSHVPKSFTVATGRSSIYFRPWQKSITPPHDNDFLNYCYDYEQLGKRIGEILANPGLERQRIARLIAKRIAPIDDSLDHLADCLPDFIAGKTRPEWIVVERKEGPAEIADIIARSETLDNHARVNVPTYALKFAYPDSPLLAAYSLHMGKAWIRETELIYGVAEPTEKILGRKLGAKTYGDIADRDIEELYEMAIDKPETGGLAKRLLAEFREAFCEKRVDADRQQGA